MRRYRRTMQQVEFDDHSNSERNLFFKRWKFRIFIGALLVFIFLIIYLYILSRDLPSLTQLEHYDPELTTKIYSRDGVIIKELFTKKRSFSPLEEIPENIINAVLATEDHSFYEHWGVNIERFSYVMLINLMHMSYQQGASTITQQLARQLYLDLEKKISRKIKEWITAIQIERTYTKNEILEMYLNQMNFGSGNYGVQAAAIAFFGKDARDLKLEECALLVGLLQRPAAYYPFRYPERAIHRRNLVLHNMLRQGFITEQQYQQAKNMPLNLKEYHPDQENGIAPYFTEFIRQELQDRFHMDLYQGGYKVHTTLDTRVQAVAEKAVNNHLPALQKKFNKKLITTNKAKQFIDHQFLAKIPYDQLRRNETLLDSLLTESVPIQVALVAMDPKDGQILAMIGGRDFEKSKWNRAVQAKRQPGSTFKPIVYTAAIDNGYSPCFELLNQPVVLYLPDGDRWAPHNYDYSQGGPTMLRDALKLSLNLVTARLVQEIVPPRTVADYGYKLGLTTPIPPYDAIALGSADVILIELTSAFGVFANQGVLTKPLYILRVEDKYGNIVDEYKPQIREVLRKESAYIMADMLKSVLNNGTGVPARTTYHFYRPAGGKTGTTNDFTDAWFVGFTPQIVSGVWVGFDDPQITLGEGQAGAVVALPIWAPFMKTAHDTLQLPVQDFEMPEGVVRMEICKETKKIPSEYCPEIISELFETRFAPTEKCDVHTGIFNRAKEDKSKRTRF
jgi:penicillin-binding protein 1A